MKFLTKKTTKVRGKRSTRMVGNLPGTRLRLVPIKFQKESLRCCFSGKRKKIDSCAVYLWGAKLHPALRALPWHPAWRVTVEKAHPSHQSRQGNRNMTWPMVLNGRERSPVFDKAWSAYRPKKGCRHPFPFSCRPRNCFSFKGGNGHGRCNFHFVVGRLPWADLSRRFRHKKE